MSCSRKRNLGLVGSAPLVFALLAGCGGTVGESGEFSSAEGFGFGSPQEDIDATIADLDPVSLTFQPFASSENSPAAASAVAFQEAVEERSGGKITLDTAWGQSIASYSELDDALADGRIDLAYTTPIYQPAEYPLFDAYNQVTHYSKTSPLVGEAISHAVMTEAGWNNPESIAEYTDRGLVPLNPHVSGGTYWLLCNSEGTAVEDWEGRQIRIGGTAQTSVAEAIGASPVSMEYAETFEALQRGTVDCTFSQGLAAGTTGLMEAGPHATTFGEGRISGGTVGGHVAGASFADLPLPYQQIIFDAATIDWFHGNIVNVLDSSAMALKDAREAGGELVAIDSEVEEIMSGAQESNVDTLIEEGMLPEDIREQMAAASEKWTAIIEDELGYEDGGEQFKLDEWYEPGTVDFRPLAERLFEEAASAHRPQ